MMSIRRIAIQTALAGTAHEAARMISDGRPSFHIPTTQ
jgi:hypothetical protein